MVSSCPHGVLSLRVRYCRWACCLFFVIVSSRPPVLAPCRIDWRGRLLKKRRGSFACLLRGDVSIISPLPAACPVPNRSHISCGSRMYRLSPPAISPRQSVSPRPSCRTRRGARRGGICPMLDLPHPIQSCCLFQFQFLALPPLARSCRFACLNWSPPPGVGGAGGSGDLRRRACGLLACVLISRIALSLVARSLSLPCPVFLRRDHMMIMSSIVFVFLRRAWRGVFSCVSFAASRCEQRICRISPRLSCRLRFIPSLARLANARRLVPSSGEVFAPFLVSSGGAVGRVVFACLLRSGRSVPFRLRRRLVLFLLITSAFALGRLPRLACFALCVPCIARLGCMVIPVLVCPYILRVWSSSPVVNSSACWDASACFVPVVFLITSVPFIVPSCRPICFSSPFSPSCDKGSGAKSCGCRPRLARRLCRCLPCVGAGCRVRLACYHFEVFSPWWCVVWVACIGRLLAVLVVYLYCELVVYIVRLDFRYG